MDECAERRVATFESGHSDREATLPDDRSAPVSRRPRTIAKLELRELDGDATEQGSGVSRTECSDPLVVPDPYAPCVFDIDLEGFLTSIGDTIGEAGMIYSFGDCELHTGPRSLRRAGRAIHLRPKVYRLLVHLLEHRHRAVSRDELCDIVWEGRCVGNATVDSTVKALRRALGDDGVGQRVVRTLSGYGYRFVATVETSAASGAALRAMLSRPSRRDGLRIRFDHPHARKDAA